MKKAMVLMGLVLAAAVVVPSAAPAKQATDIPVAPALAADIPVAPAYAYMARGLTGDAPVAPTLIDIPVAPIQLDLNLFGYMARGFNSESPTDANLIDIPVGPSLIDIPVGPVAYMARGLKSHHNDVAYMARGKNANSNNGNAYGHDKIIVIG